MHDPRWHLSARWFATLLATFAGLTAATWMLAPHIRVLLSTDDVRALDSTAWQQARHLATPAMLTIADLSNAVHGTAGILVLCLMAALAWHLGGRPQACIRVLIALPAGMLLNVLLKIVVARARPSWAIIDLPHSASFPSGHVAEATVFYGCLAIEVARRHAQRWQQALSIVVAVAMVGITAFSRIVVGAHFLSDCLAANLEAAMWLAACFSGPPLSRSEAREAPSR